jgi:hypothetical protein
MPGRLHAREFHLGAVVITRPGHRSFWTRAGRGIRWANPLGVEAFGNGVAPLRAGAPRQILIAARSLAPGSRFRALPRLQRTG